MNDDVHEMFDVRDRSVLITGASGSLGSAAARCLGRAGAKLTLASGDLSRLEKLAAELQEQGVEVQVTEKRAETIADTDAVVDLAVDAFGGVDILICAAGTNDIAEIIDQPTEAFETVIDANMRGSWLACKSAGKQMIKQGRGGKVILLSSTRGKLGLAAGYSAYCASKSGVDGITRALGCEWGKYKINVNAIGPTVFRSELTDWMYVSEGPGKGVREEMLKRIPLGRLGEPDDFNGAVVFLSSKASDFCTGQVFYIDGGYTAG
jgi:NAD(P)-dependent dehydrogenase (short-subunit alcohol dehydrogenase family)